MVNVISNGREEFVILYSISIEPAGCADSRYVPPFACENPSGLTVGGAMFPAAGVKNWKKPPSPLWILALATAPTQPC